MITPEYSITSKTLKNISNIEYCKGIIENTTILPIWDDKIIKDTLQNKIYSILRNERINTDKNQIKMCLDNLSSSTPTEISNIHYSLVNLDTLTKNINIEESEIKEIHRIISNNLIDQKKQGSYRSTKIDKKTPPEEILAEVVQLFDWYNSLDAQETHTLIKTAILKAYLEIIHPFEDFNKSTTDILCELSLKFGDYKLINKINIIDYYMGTKHEYESIVASLDSKYPDMTTFIEYYTEGMSLVVSNLCQNIKLLAKDTKIAKASGRIKLTQRQERIVEYIQDYGILQNKDFPRVFPNVSEDTVLRDLKLLIDKDIVQKTGSTKSSKYELK